MLSVYTRHYAPCPHTDKSYRRCKCPKWIQGTLPGQTFFRRAGTKSWQRAEREARRLEAEGEARLNAEHPEPPVQIITLTQAVDRYLQDKEQQHIQPSTQEKLETIFRKQLLEWANDAGLVNLDEITLEHLEDFRSTWKGTAITHKKKQERINSFFRFCVDRDWILRNRPASSLLSAPRTHG